jgi:hypothetical protein
MVTVSKYARLNKDELDKVQTLEKQINKIVLAYEPDKQSPYADLNEAQVEKIRALEREFGVTLLAYKTER